MREIFGRFCLRLRGTATLQSYPKEVENRFYSQKVIFCFILLTKFDPGDQECSFITSIVKEDTFQYYCRLLEMHLSSNFIYLNLTV